jgi:hypothetical protein
MRTPLIPLILLLAACSGSGKTSIRVEGTEAGDCTDGADNDADGVFDCDDPGCDGAPDCDPGDTDPGDTDGVTDTSGPRDTGAPGVDDTGDTAVWSPPPVPQGCDTVCDWVEIDPDDGLYVASGYIDVLALAQLSDLTFRVYTVDGQLVPSTAARLSGRARDRVRISVPSLTGTEPELLIVEAETHCNQSTVAFPVRTTSTSARPMPAAHADQLTPSIWGELGLHESITWNLLWPIAPLAESMTWRGIFDARGTGGDLPVTRPDDYTVTVDAPPGGWPPSTLYGAGVIPKLVMTAPSGAPMRVDQNFTHFDRFEWVCGYWGDSDPDSDQYFDLPF